MKRIQQKLYRLTIAAVAAIVLTLAGGALNSTHAQNTDYMIYGTWVYTDSFTGQRSVVLNEFNTATNMSTSHGLPNFQPNEKVMAMDFRPSNNQLYALGSTGRLYQINPNTYNVTVVSQTPISIPIDGGRFYDMDFNPVSDLIRVVVDTRQNFRIDPNTGQVVNNTADTSLYFPPGHPRHDTDGNNYVTGIAYNNNTAGVTQTTAYVYYHASYGDDGFQTLGVPNSGQPGPNSGQLFESTHVGLYDTSSADAVISMDIPKNSNYAFLLTYAFANPQVLGQRNIYRVDLSTGARTRLTNNSDPNSPYIFFAYQLDTLAISPIAPQPAIQPGQVLISEFRYNGPNGQNEATGQNDEYVELYNNTDAPLNMNGYRLVFGRSSGQTEQRACGNVTIPARGHFLFASTDFSLGAYSQGQDSLANPAGSSSTLKGMRRNIVLDEANSYLARDQSISLLRPLGNETIIDTVGFTGNDSGLVEGTPLSPANIQGGAGTPQYAFVRRSDASGRPVDTNNNRNDFVLVSATGAGVASTGIPTILGMPSPQSTMSPVTTAAMAGSYIDPVVGSAAPPNRVRIGSGNAGSLKIRRRLTNNTGQTVHSLRLTIYDITTLGTSVAAPPQADLRAVTSTDESAQTSFGPVALRGTTLELGNMQTGGGGLNSSYTVPLPASGLAPGSSIDLQFQLNVVLNGRFRFFVNVDVN
jgi:hypothetical protein